eukprot:154167-Prorocentrum_minimum.AAC.1
MWSPPSPSPPPSSSPPPPPRAPLVLVLSRSHSVTFSARVRLFNARLRSNVRERRESLTFGHLLAQAREGGVRVRRRGRGGVRLRQIGDDGEHQELRCRGHAVLRHHRAGVLGRGAAGRCGGPRRDIIKDVLQELTGRLYLPTSLNSAH